MRRKYYLALLLVALLLAVAVVPAFAIVDPLVPAAKCKASGGLVGGQAVANGAIGGPGNSPDGEAPVNAPVPINNPGNANVTANSNQGAANCSNNN